MMLTDEDGVPQAALPLAAFRDHLRLGSGFADDALQDALAESHLRAAIAAIEARTAQVIVARRFLWVLEDWRDGVAQALPVAPVTGIVSVTLFDAAGGALAVAPDRYRLVRDLHRPKIAATGTLLPVVPVDGRIELRFDAGFGPGWEAVPADLAQAVLLLAAEFYENRHQAVAVQGAGLPHAVQGLIERWRTVRVLGGAW